MKFPKRDKFHGNPLFSNCFFIKIDDLNNVLAISDNLINQFEDMDLLISSALYTHDTNIIYYNNIKLQFKVFNKSYGKLIVFLDTHPTESVLNRLLIISSIIGSLSLLLVFAISFFWTSKALVPLKESWERQKSFTGDASHELRTPLAVMQSNIDILIDNTDMTAEDQKPWLDNINYEIKNMTTLTNSLLELARFDEENTHIELNNFDINNLLNYIQQSFTTMCKDKNLSFAIEKNDVNTLFGNEFEIKRLLIILIDNAIKYTPNNGSIKLSLVTKNKSTEILVSDTGIGMTEDEIDHIFHRFYRVDKVRERSVGGFGLGLSMANLIVKLHKGKINVLSKPDNGSTFIITLPKKGVTIYN